MPTAILDLPTPVLAAGIIIGVSTALVLLALLCDYAAHRADLSPHRSWLDVADDAIVGPIVSPGLIDVEPGMREASQRELDRLARWERDTDGGERR